MPRDYKRVLAAARRAERDGLDVSEAVDGRGEWLREHDMADPRGFMTTPRQTPGAAAGRRAHH